MSSKPASKGGQLLETAINYYWSAEVGRANDIQRQRALNTIDKLLGSVPGDPEGLMARGIFMCADDDISAIRTIEDAVARLPYEPAARLNLITALMHFGFLDRALSQARHVWDMSEKSSHLLERLIRYSLMSGQIAAASALIDQWERMFPDRDMSESVLDQRDIIQLALDDHPRAEPEAIGDAIALATQLGRDHGYAPRISQFEMLRDESATWLRVSSRRTLSRWSILMKS